MYVQRQRCCRLERFSNRKKIYFENVLGYSSVVNFYSAGVVTRDRSIDPWFVWKYKTAFVYCLNFYIMFYVAFRILAFNGRRGKDQ
jgi:hypothetical protein